LVVRAGRSEDPAATPLESAASEVEQIKQKIESIYAKHAPERVGKVDGLLKKYKGKERKLIEAIENKYVKATMPPLPARPEEQSSLPPPAVLPRQSVALPAVASSGDEEEEERKRDLRRRWKGGVSDAVLQAMLEKEDRLLEDFDRVFPLPVDMPGISDYGPLMVSERRRAPWHHLIESSTAQEFVFDDDDKRFKRMMCPLHRVSAPEQLDDEDDAGGRHLFDANPFRRLKVDKPPEPKILPMPGPKQAAAADRLMKGYSAIKSAESERGDRVNVLPSQWL
jgi:hypothetical protein